MTIEEAFIKYKEIFDYANIGKQLEEIVDIEKLLKTPMMTNEDSGLAYEGAVIYYVIMTWHFATQILKIYNKIATVSSQSLAKVICLCQLGKIDWFESNTNEWQVKTLGKKYNFVDNNVCLKLSERSKLICTNSGISFTPEEYEAMSIIEKTSEEYDAMSKYRTHLSTIFKMSHDLAIIAMRERYKQEKK